MNEDDGAVRIDVRPLQDAAQDTAQDVGTIPTPPARTLALNSTTSCASDRAGALFCWGLNSSSVRGANPSPLQVVDETPLAFSVGHEHFCIVDASGEVLCHGPIGNYGVRSGPVELAAVGVSGAVGVASGLGMACALLANGQVTCWGSEIRPGGVQCRAGAGLPPQVVPGVDDAVDVAVGQSFGCALSVTGRVQCWGCNGAWQIDASPFADPVAEAAVDIALPPIRSLALGDSHACAISVDGDVFCWGDNAWGQLATGDRGPVVSPHRVDVPEAIVQVGLAHRTTCMLGASGTTYCSPKLPDGANPDGSCTGSMIEGVLHPVLDLDDAVEIDIGTCHICARRGNGDVVCRGCNLSGAVGSGREGCEPDFVTVL